MTETVAFPAAADRPSWIALRAHPASAAIARRFAGDVTAGHPFDPYDVALVTSELVTNAIRHARPCGDEWPIRLEIAVHDGHAHISVTDPDPTPIRPGRCSGDGGRGLALVDAHATDRTVTYRPDGKTVTVRLPACGDTA